MADFIALENPVLVYTCNTDNIAFVGEAVFPNSGDPIFGRVFSGNFWFLWRCRAATTAVLMLKMLQFRHFVVLFQVVILKRLMREVFDTVMPEYWFWRPDFRLTQTVERVA